MFNKASATALAPVGDGSRWTAVLSSPEPDCEGDRILGWKWDAETLPLMVGHQHGKLPVGTVRPYWVNGRLMGTLSFPPVGTSAASDEARRLVESGIASAVSIAFAGEGRRNDHGGQDFSEVAVKEVSLVGVACCDAARIEGRAKCACGGRGEIPRDRPIRIVDDRGITSKSPGPALAAQGGTLAEPLTFAEVRRRREAERLRAEQAWDAQSALLESVESILRFVSDDTEAERLLQESANQFVTALVGTRAAYAAKALGTVFGRIQRTIGVKAGRVLSAENERRVREAVVAMGAAVTALREVLGTLEGKRREPVLRIIDDRPQRNLLKVVDDRPGGNGKVLTLELPSPEAMWAEMHDRMLRTGRLPG